MSSKVANYLEQHLMGEVMTSADALNYFSTDGSIFSVRPKIVVYPRNTSDVRKTARFSWQLAEKGHVLPITPRGKGTDLSGAALGEGIMMVFPAHMNKILELDKNTVTVQPGTQYSKLQQTLHTHGRFLPPYPASIEYSTIAGSLANNDGGEKSYKYGKIDKYTNSLQLVLANGELIKTERLGKRALKKKKAEDSFEGHIYRELDKLLTEHAAVIEQHRPAVTHNSAGYNLWDIKDKKGTFDLTPLILGSQATLGIISQATLKTEAYNPATTLVVGFFENFEQANQAIHRLGETKPSALEMIDGSLLQFVKKHHPEQLRGIVGEPFPDMVVICEYDDLSDRTQKRKTKKAKKILQDLSYEFRVTRDEHEKETLWKIRHSASAVLWQEVDGAKGIPVIEDAIVPVAKRREFIERTKGMLEKLKIDSTIWGQAGDANIRLRPMLDLRKTTDRQMIFKLMDEHYKNVVELGGSTSAFNNDGRLRAPYVRDVFGEQMYALMQEVKELFDPHGTLNPGVKINVEKKDLVPLLRKDYNLEHLYEHMPRG